MIRGRATAAASKRGRYVLFTDFTAGWIFGRNSETRRGGVGGGHADTLKGIGVLCTESGVTYTFDTSGRVYAWRSTSDAEHMVAPEARH